MKDLSECERCSEFVGYLMPRVRVWTNRDVVFCSTCSNEFDMWCNRLPEYLEDMKLIFAIHTISEQTIHDGYDRTDQKMELQMERIELTERGRVKVNEWISAGDKGKPLE